jgi:uridine phosphorylase
VVIITHFLLPALVFCSSMVERRFEHANNPSFECAEDMVLLPFGRRSYLPAAAELYGGEEVALDETTDRIVYRLRDAASPLMLMYSGMGGPAVANALEMASANGARRVVVFGACGGVDVRVEVGDLVVASGAVRGEGTSRYYASPEYPAVFDPLLTTRLWRAIEQRTEVSAHLGVVYTTDAGYRQGPEVYERHAGLALAVESECAAVAVVAARLGLESAAVLFCTDNPSLPREEDRRYGGLADGRVCRAFEAGLAAVVAALASEPE